MVHHHMIGDVFCTLCGGPVVQRDVIDSSDPKPPGMYWDYDSKLVSDEKLRWLVPLRIIGRRHNIYEPEDHGAPAEAFTASGCDVGNFFRAWDAAGNQHWCETYECNTSKEYASYHYILHQNCLTILEHAISSYHAFPRALVLNDFYEVLCADLVRFDVMGPGPPGMLWEHGFYGAAMFWDQEWVAKRGWEFLVANPLDVPDMTSYILSRLHALPASDNSSISAPNKTTSASFTSNESAPRVSPSTRDLKLQTLPSEIITKIASYLHIKDIFSWRLSGKDMSLRLPLDQRFWREQLTSGMLFGLWDFDKRLVRDAHLEPEAWDWKRLVGTLAKYESFVGAEGGKPRSEWGEMHDAPIGLKNRRRIWKVITDVKMPGLRG